MFEIIVKPVVNNHLCLEISCCKVARGWHSTSNLKSWETFQHFKCQIQHFLSIKNMFEFIVKHIVNNDFSLKSSSCKEARGWHNSSNLKSWETFQHFKCQVKHFHTVEYVLDPVVKHVVNNNFCLENSCCEVARGRHSSSNLKSWQTIKHF